MSPARLAAIALLAAATTTASACDRDTAGPNAPAGHYTLVSLGGVTPPVSGTLESLDAPGVVCADTVFSYHLRLKADGTGSRSAHRKVYCPGQAPRTVGGSSPATWRAGGDSLWIDVINESPFGPVTVTWNGAIEGDRLVFRYPVYTEADPDGTSGLTYDIVWRRNR